MSAFPRAVAASLVLFFALAAGTAVSQVSSLFYKEIEKDGRVYVFNTVEKLATFQRTGEMGVAITIVGHGPNGETVVAENETALDLYNLKHDRPAYERPAPKPAAAPPLPTAIKIADGELRFGSLIQVWYVTDDSPRASTTSFFGNTTGLNTFRLRRAELKLSGRITPSWGFELMLDPAKSIFANQTVAGTTVSAGAADNKILQDLAVTFLGLKGHELSLGQKKLPITEEGLRGSPEIDFVERARMTRAFSDRRETGFFYKGEYGKRFAAWASVTNGTISNSNDDSNDTVFFAARFDVKPVAGVVAGVSGGVSGGEGPAHLGRTRLGAHLKYDGPETLPIGFRAEYLAAHDDLAGGGTLRRDGFIVTGLYTFAARYQAAARWDVIDNDRDAARGRTETFTCGFHYLVMGRNLNIKADWHHVKEEGRKIDGVPAESYSQLVVAAQAAF